MKFSSAADYHPGAPKTVEGNAALLDKSSFSWNDYPVRNISDPETKINPNPKPLFGNKLNQDSMENSGYAGNAGLIKGAKISGGGGNSGAIVSPNPFGGLSAYQDPDQPVGKLPKSQSGGI